MLTGQVAVETATASGIPAVAVCPSKRIVAVVRAAGCSGTSRMRRDAILRAGAAYASVASPR